MAHEAEIIAAIESIAGKNFNSWRLGVTNDPIARKAEHGNPKTWEHWEVSSEQSARNVENYFLLRGMKGGPRSSGKATYIYIF